MGSIACFIRFQICSRLRPILVGLLAFCAGSFKVVAVEQMDVIHFPSGTGTLIQGMRHTAASHPNGSSPVLILHGATFPSGNAAAWKIEGHSWMERLAEQGYDVYALDFLGYGISARYPEMRGEDPRGTALGDVASMVQQVERAEAVILARTRVKSLNLIAHSAGTYVAARYAELHPDRVAKLILFGAPTPSNTGEAAAAANIRYFQVSANDQLEGFEPQVRTSGRLDARMFPLWVTAYLASDPLSGARQPASVRVPAGMIAAVDEMNRTGKLPYDPEKIMAPTLVIQGEWDAVTPPSSGLWLFERIGAPFRRLVILSQGGHRLHLEESRVQLYQEVQAFLAARPDMSARSVSCSRFQTCCR
jgi:pimeloyl-ACP methyl ester carboxylesterase